MLLYYYYYLTSYTSVGWLHVLLTYFYFCCLLIPDCAFTFHHRTTSHHLRDKPTQTSYALCIHCDGVWWGSEHAQALQLQIKLNILLMTTLTLIITIESITTLLAFNNENEKKQKRLYTAQRLSAFLGLTYKSPSSYGKSFYFLTKGFQVSSLAALIFKIKTLSCRM